MVKHCSLTQMTYEYNQIQVSKVKNRGKIFIMVLKIREVKSLLIIGPAIGPAKTHSANIQPSWKNQRASTSGKYNQGKCMMSRYIMHPVLAWESSVFGADHQCLPKVSLHDVHNKCC